MSGKSGLRIYHGTVGCYLPDILKHGLKYTPDNVWQLVYKRPDGTFDPGPGSEHPGYIFLTTNEDTAEVYAHFRTLYLAWKPDSSILNGYVFNKDLWKPAKAPVIKHASPVVLQIDTNGLDPNLLERDENQDNAVKYRGIIKPSSIHVVERKAA